MSQHNQTTQDGAIVCLAALKEMKERFDSDEVLEMSYKNWDQERDKILDEICEAAGHQSDFTFGFIRALAEYIESCVNGVVPELDCFKPDSALSKAELQSKRDILYLEYADVEV